MGALVNASTLLSDAQWRGIITAAALYTAREVLQEADSDDAAVRRALARQTISSPAQTVSYLVALVGTDPDIAGTYSAANIASIADALVIGKVNGLWTALAKNLVAS